MPFEQRKPGNFNYQSPVNPAAEAQLAQRKAEIEQADKARHEQNTLTAAEQGVKAASDVVTGMIENSKARQTRQFVDSLADSLAASSAIKANQSPTKMGAGFASTASFDPTQADAMRAAVHLNHLKAADTYIKANFETPKPTEAPISAATKNILATAYKKLGQPMPDTTGMTDVQGRQHFMEVIKLLDDKNDGFTLGEKQNQLDEKNRQKFNDTTNYEKSARGATGQAASALRGVGQLKALFDGYKNDLTPQEWEEASIAWARILSAGGGVTSREQVKALLPKTAVGNVKAAMQWYTNNPTGTSQQKFAERMRLGMEREETFNSKYLKDKTLAQLGSYVPTYMRTDPVQAREELEAKGLTKEDVKKKYPALADRLWKGEKTMSAEDEANQFLQGF